MSIESIMRRYLLAKRLKERMSYKADIVELVDQVNDLKIANINLKDGYEELLAEAKDHEKVLQKKIDGALTVPLTPT